MIGGYWIKNTMHNKLTLGGAHNHAISGEGGVQTTELSCHDSDWSGSGQVRAGEHKQGYNIGRMWKRIDRSPKEMGKLELGWVGARNCVIVRGSSGSAERLNLSCCGSIFPTDG